MTKINISINIKDINVLTNILDLYSRLGSGQLEELISQHNSPIVNQKLSEDEKEKLKQHIQQIKEILFPELGNFSSYGIFSNKITDDVKFSYDILQVIRNKVAWYNNPKGGINVNFDEPLKSSSRPLIEVNISD